MISGGTMKISKVVGGNTEVQKTAANHFHHALEQNNPSLLPEILKNRHVDFMEDGLTLLHRSVLAERIEFVQQLISLGASATLATRDGFSPLHLAAFTGNSDILILLLKSSSGTSDKS